MYKKLIIYLGFFLVASGVGASITNAIWEAKYLKLENNYSKQIQENQAQTIERERQLRQITSLQNERDNALEKARKTKATVVEKEVIIYASNPDNNCNIDDDFVRIYNNSKPVSRTP